MDAVPPPAVEKEAGLTVLQLLRPHRRALLLGLIASLGESVADVLEPWPLKIVIDNVIGHKPGKGWLLGIAHRTAGYGTGPLLVFACAFVLVIALVNAVCTYGEKYVTTSVGQWVTHDLRRRLYDKVQRLSMSFHDHASTGDLISRVTGDIDSVQSFIVSGLLSIVVDVLTLVVMVGVMFHVNWRFTLVALAVVPVLFTIVYSYTRRVKKMSREVRRRESSLLSVVQEVVSSIRVVKAFARENYENRRLEGESLEAVEASLRARAMKARLVPLVNMVTAAGVCGVLYFGGRAALANDLSVGSIVVFLSYITKMYKPMQDISKIMDSYSKADIGYERIQEVMETTDVMCDRAGAVAPPRLRGQIDLDHVSFCYANDKPVLQDVDLHAQPGQTIALVGATGSGKSTIINMIARLYDPMKGEVRIDGVDIRKWKQRLLREQLSFVLQDTVLFSGTIWDNIAYGRPEATHDEIVRAAEAANAMEFINKLPGQFDAEVGERGVQLSGGQRQRIAIARAIIRNTPILLLDEPSSGLDAESEQLVFEALDRLMQGRTSVVVAHRLSTIRRADCIYVIRDGHVAESGTHEELLQRENGEYRKLHDIQFAGQEIEVAA